MTAGKKLATAVPEVDRITTGSLLDFAIPIAKNPEDRSSTILKHLMILLFISARVKGVLRAPGEMHAWRIPCASKKDSMKLQHFMLLSMLI